MSLSREIREQVISIPGSGTEFHSVFHVLDSLHEETAKKAGKQLQKILLQNFEGINFQEERMAVKAPQVFCLVFFSIR